MKELKGFFSSASVKNIGIFILLGVLTVFFYPDRAFLSGVNAGEDTLVMDIPHAAFFLRSLHEGAFPLWNPYKVCGLPFFEVSFMGPYYPGVILYLLFPIEKALNYGFLIHIYISALLMFLLCREFKFNRIISLFCCASWAFSSIFAQFSESGWLPQIISVSYLPGLIYLFIKTKNEEHPVNIIFCLLSVLTVGLIITGGIFHYASVVIYLFLFFAVPLIRDKKYIIYLFIILLFGLLISAVYWGPALLQLKGSVFAARGFTGYDLKELVNFLFPSMIRRGFAGKLVLVLGMAGLFLKSPYSRSLRLLFLVSLFLMFSHNEVMGIRPISFLPFANKDGYVWPWHAGLIFSLILSSGISLERLRYKLADKKGILLILLGLLFIMQFTDLYCFNLKLYPRSGFDFKLGDYYRRYPFVDYLKKDKALFRISSRIIDDFYSFVLLRENQGMLEGIGCFESRVRGINLNRVTGKNVMTYYHRTDFSKELSSRTRDLCNIKYIITDKKQKTGDFSRCLSIRDPADAREVYLDENNSCFPRAFLLEGIDRGELEEYILRDYKKPLLELMIPDKAWGILKRYREAEIRYSPNTYSVKLRSDAGSFLFLSEMFFKGWRVKVDGRRTELYSPFGLFMGVFLPAGEHTIVFEFKPLYFYIFAGISLSTILFVLFMALCIILKSSRGLNPGY